MHRPLHLLNIFILFSLPCSSDLGSALTEFLKDSAAEVHRVRTNTNSREKGIHVESQEHRRHEKLDEGTGDDLLLSVTTFKKCELVATPAMRCTRLLPTHQVRMIPYCTRYDMELSALDMKRAFCNSINFQRY